MSARPGVRNFFEQACALAPAIIFVGEIDALGTRREYGGYAGSDEREQTLNQLLAEMDGFDQSSRVVVLAARTGPTHWTQPCADRADLTAK